MKKTFKLVHPKIKPARLIEAVRRDVKKYNKREKRKSLSEGGDYWGFDCKYGPTEAKAEIILTSEISKCISCLLYTSPSPRDAHESRMPSSA